MDKEYNVIIAGGRDFNNYKLLHDKVDLILKNKNTVCIISGLAKGADTLGIEYAKNKGLNIKYFPAKWELYGKRAGMLRNKEMGNTADALIVFWNGKSVGTKNMIDYMKKLNKPIRIIYY